MEINFNDKDFVEFYINMVKDYDNTFIVEHFKKEIPLNNKVLELGCGIGLDYCTLKDFYNYQASDYSDVFLEKLKEKYDDNFIKINALTIDINETFDCIFSNKVLQVFNDKDMRKSFTRQNEILNESGMIFHCMWFGKNDFDEANYVTEETLKNILDGLFDYKLIKYSEIEENDSVIVIGKKIN